MKTPNTFSSLRASQITTTDTVTRTARKQRARAAALAGAEGELEAPTVPLIQAQGGIRAANVLDPESYVVVQIPANLHNAQGDTILLYWQEEDFAVDQYEIRQGDATRVISMKVSAVDIKRVGDGSIEVWYERVSRTPGEPRLGSPPVKVTVKTTIPGGDDPDPIDTPYVNENLKAPSITPPGVIDREAAEEGVTVTVQAWQNMAVGDRLTVNWGSRSIGPLVIQGAEVASPVEVPVNSQAILDAGDSDNLIVAYSIRDIVGQWSKYSKISQTVVEASGDEFDAPDIVQSHQGVIDVDSLGTGDADVLVYVNNTMAVDDTVILTFEGQANDGWSIIQVSSAQVEEGHGSVSMKITNAVLASVTPGNASLYYRVLDSHQQSRGRSRRTQVQVSGTPMEIPAPKVAEARGSVLDPADATNGATVTTDARLPLKAGDEVLWTWNGVASDDRPDCVTKKQIIKQENEHIAEFIIPAANIELIAGGHADVYYTITRGDIRRESVHTSLTIAGEGRLAAPKVAGVEGSVLSLDAVPNDAEITIPAWDNMSVGDTVDWFWHSQSPEGSAQDSVTVNVIGADIVAHVAHSVLEVDVATEAFVTVSYTVTRVGDGVPVNSRWTQFNVVGSPEIKLAAPSVDGAVDNVLNPDSLPDRGATVRVRPYQDKEAGDHVIVWFGKGTEAGQHSQKFDVSGKTIDDDITMVVPKSTVEFHRNGKSVVVQYTVTRNADGKDVDSDLLALDVRAEAKWPAPAVDEAEGDYFDPVNIPFGATIRVYSNPGMRSGDLITIHWDAQDGEIPPYTDYMPVKNPRDYTFTMPATELQKWNGQIVRVSYIVTGNARFVSSETLRLRIGVDYPATLPAPIIPEAHDGILDPDQLILSATATIPASAGLSAGDHVRMQWAEGSDGMTWGIDVAGSNVGHDITRPIPIANITPFLGKSPSLFYVLENDPEEPRRSHELKVTVEHQEMVLPVPKVPDATDNILDPRGLPAEGAKVSLRHVSGMLQADKVKLHWDCSIEAGIFENDKTIGSGTNDIDITVPLAKIFAGESGTVNVWYEWLRAGKRLGASSKLELTIKFSKLPLATIDEANGTTLDPNDVPDTGATIRLASDGHFKYLDHIDLCWKGETDDPPRNFPHDVLSTEADKDITILVEKSFVEAYNGTNITLNYTVTRRAGGEPEKSENSQYYIHTELGIGDLHIMGARSNGTAHRASGGVQYMRALNKNTKEDIVAEWSYEDQQVWTVGFSFKDTRPWVPLKVRTASSLVTINPVNVFGSGGNSTTTTGLSALTAIYETGKNGFSVVSWGNALYGGAVGATNMTHDDVVEVSSTQSAFCARRSTGRVFTWGNADQGGTIPPTTVITDAKRVVGNSSAFVAICGSGSVSTLRAWGVGASGGTLTDEAGALTDVVKVAAAGSAFCALRRNNQLVAWGDKNNGGDASGYTGMDDFVDVRGNFTAFCALRSNNSVVAWGASNDGGTVPQEIATRRDIIELASASARAFAVRTETNGVMAWGNAANGGTIPSEIKSQGFTDIEEVTATWGAFCARRARGTVVVWGDPARGGTFPAALSGKNNSIVQVVGTGGAFAALRSDGSVIAWPNTVKAGNTAPVDNLLVNIRAIYANSEVFVAVKDDGGVVVWGEAGGGGDNASVPEILKTKLHYEAVARGLAGSSRRNKVITATDN